ncbi:putative lipid II flippase FtsW [Candidatus Nitrospira nitrificans]|uniref:Probable peptidoglycan glycosyltransferase FtsW n=1 Tax=Candidatus Nitrospira nitrificans TaxID=1742973 RepID=A0A0S4LFN5_9BACT|nr:putative lipid II flippase FtsW [Candidatus Nitrospira nitrificans]CUS34790.1 Lipid II flippase FtsW [Candidatus Nitrospira nitrificans]
MSQRSAGTLALPWPTGSPQGPKRPGMDHVLLCVTITLTLIGLVMVFSASAVVAGNRFHDSWYYLKRQLAWLTFGLAFLHVVSRIDYVWWRRLGLPLLGLIMVLLVAVLIPSIGAMRNGARRWLDLRVITVQPAEMAKLIGVIYLAAYLAKKEDQLQQFSTGLLPALLIIGILSGLVLLEPDLGTVVMLGLVTGGLLFVGGARLSHLSTLALVALPIGLVLILTSDYRRQRFMAFWEPWRDASDTGFQITQSFLAFGSGGLFGVGLGEGKQKLFFLPEAHTDFVLALVGEELGFVGTGMVVLLFVLFVIRGFQISSRARIPFGRYLGIGITTLIGIQALINACVVTGLLPTKGLTLPFVSYGGSSLVISLIGVGILLNISRDRQAGREETREQGRRGWASRP